MQVSALYLHPVKSLRGIRVERAELDARGLRGDRRWMVVDPEGGFLTQREHPRLALVHTALTDGHIQLTAPGMAPLTLPRVWDGPRQPVTVWRSTVPAAAHPAGGGWLSDFLGRRCRLVHMPPDVHRAMNPDHARPEERVSFADGYPLLITSQASLDALNQRLVQRGAAPVTMERFRPNVVVTGCAPFAEDALQRVAIGGVSFRGPKLCERCVVTTIDPETGQRSGGEPLKSLAALHTVGGRICFGMNLIHDGPGALRVGDPVRPL